MDGAGASQGSGRAVALSLARRGYNVALCSRTEATLEATQAEVAAVAGKQDGAVERTFALPTDLTSAEDVAAFADQVSGRFEQVDLLINCAGVCCSGSFEDTCDAGQFESQFESNLMTAVRPIRAFLPMLKARAAKSGGRPAPRVVNINSFGGKLPLRNMTAYTATKFALDGLSQALAFELADEGVKVSQVHPGVIQSSFLERAQFVGERGKKAQETMNAMLGPDAPGGGMVQSPDDIADAVLDCIENDKAEVVVGGLFKASIGMNKYLGLNPFGLAQP